MDLYAKMLTHIRTFKTEVCTNSFRIRIDDVKEEISWVVVCFANIACHGAKLVALRAPRGRTTRVVWRVHRVVAAKTPGIDPTCAADSLTQVCEVIECFAARSLVDDVAFGEQH